MLFNGQFDCTGEYQFNFADPMVDALNHEGSASSSKTAQFSGPMV